MSISAKNRIGRTSCENAISLSNNAMKIVLKMKNGIKEFVFFVLERLSPSYDKSKPIDKVKIRKILVFEGGGIGDLVRVFPAIESLHDNFPAASISILASRSAIEGLHLFSKREILSEVIDYDLKGKHKSLLGKVSLIFLLRRRHYDLVYSPSRGEGMREVYILSFLIGAPHRLGFKKGRVGLLNTIKIEFRDNAPIMEQNLAVLKAAGLKLTQEKIDLTIPEEYVINTQHLLNESGRNPIFPIVTIHPGATWNAKHRCWPIEKFICLIRTLLQEFAAKVIIIGGKDEIEVGEKISREIQNPSLISLIGKTTIAQMAAVIKFSHLFIGNDSGTLHIALAVKTPSIAIFGSTSPDQVLNSHERCIVVRKDLPCSPCYLHQYDYMLDCKDVRCMNEITVDEVVGWVRRALTEDLNENTNIIGNA